MTRLSYLRINNPGSLAMFAAIQIDLAFVASGSNSGPKAKQNGRPDHERDHNCVPQRHGAFDCE